MQTTLRQLKILSNSTSGSTLEIAIRKYVPIESAAEVVALVETGDVNSTISALGFVVTRLELLGATCGSGAEPRSSAA
eukprot:931198-Rhodomonas_salina.1